MSKRIFVIHVKYIFFGNKITIVMFFQEWNTASIEIIRTKLIQDIAKLVVLTNLSVAPELPGPEVTEIRMCKLSQTSKQVQAKKVQCDSKSFSILLITKSKH